MTSPLARYLTDFTVRPQTSAGPSQTEGSADTGMAAAVAPPPLDIDAERAAAREDGWRQGREALQAEHAARIMEIETRHAAALDALEQRYQAELADRLAGRFVELRDEVGRDIGREAAQALVPLIDQAVARSMAERLAACVGEVIGDRQAVRLTVHGPAYLFGYLKELPAMAPFELHHVEAEEPDLRIEIDDSVLATRMKVLSAALAEAMP